MQEEQKHALVVFQDKKIRREWHNGEWYFSVVDIVEVLTESPAPRQYWGKLKDREFVQLELSPIWVQLKLLAEDGKMRETDCANTKSMFRIIQSIPSKHAEPFKLWLAQVGYERVQEIQNPELAQERIREYYRLKGYPKEWIEKRLQSIAIRQELTEEWNRVGIEEETDFAILTNEITKAWSGKTVSEYKGFKELKKENLRDHMTNMELVLNMLAETTTTEISKKESPRTFLESEDIARKGGAIAGNARKDIEKQLGRSVVSPENAKKYLENSSKKALEKKHKS